MFDAGRPGDRITQDRGSGEVFHVREGLMQYLRSLFPCSILRRMKGASVKGDATKKGTPGCCLCHSLAQQLDRELWWEQPKGRKKPKPAKGKKLKAGCDLYFSFLLITCFAEGQLSWGPSSADLEFSEWDSIISTAEEWYLFAIA